MDKKNKNVKTKTDVEFSYPLQVTEPNITLFQQLYYSCKLLNPKEITSRLIAVTTNIDRKGRWLNPCDAEVIWLILGYLCDRNIADDDIRQMAKVIEHNKMYNHVGVCCTNVMQMINLDNFGKKRKLEKLLRALCKTTTLYLTISYNSVETIRRKFFLDLYNTAQSPSIQALNIKPIIVRRLELIHWMLKGSEYQDHMGIEFTSHEEIIKDGATENLFTIEPPGDIVNLNLVPSHQDIFQSGQVFLRPNFIRRPYPDLETYRDV